jgi:hypothetical protein
MKVNIRRCNSRLDLSQLGLLVLIFVCAPIAVQAQVESGKVAGAVHDASGAVLVGAKITVTNVDTNVSRSAAASASGEYVVTQLPPGTYTLLAEHQGSRSRC